ncbi:hypothetical protein MMC25_002690 [Agyrium rufum]|nr:hypothetical protein [Agyrium rufum]
MFPKTTTLALGLCSLLAAPTFAAVHEQLAADGPVGWSHVATPSDDEIMVLSVALKQQNLDQLESLIYAVSTPGSAKYGQHMEGDAVSALIAPSKEANAAVVAWLKSAGVKTIHSDGSYVNFAAKVGTMNKVLNTEFKHYEKSGVRKLRTTQYSVPDDVAEHVDFLHPTVFFGNTVANAALPTVMGEKKIEARQAAPLNCSVEVNAECLKELYNVKYTPKGKTAAKVGFGSFLNQSASYADLAAYEVLNGIPSQSFSVQLINGGVNDQAIDGNHGEANLDVENIVGLSHPLPVVEFITGGSPPFIPNLDEPTAADNSNEPYLQYYEYLLAQPNSALPQVITNSYGDDEQTVPENYAKRVCNMVGQLGLRGISVLESSGDNGVGAPCQSNDGNKTPQFTPQFPGTCPFITGVGGTVGYARESGWIGSGGGFSNYFPRPSYQDGAVSSYLALHISKAEKAYFAPFANFNNRGFPDVAALSVQPYYQVVVNNRTGGSGGTSAASPVFAAIIGLVNDARFAAGKGPLGFLNPMLYSTGFNALTDITTGGNGGCTGVSIQSGAPVVGASVIPFAGFNCTKGWDPVTGLGVPNAQKLIKLGLTL